MRVLGFLACIAQNCVVVAIGIHGLDDVVPFGLLAREKVGDV